MSSSTMVVASKYLLKEHISVNQGTFNPEGRKELIHTKIVKRAFVEERNSQNNNELYIIDEDATYEMLIQREESIKANNEKAKREKVSNADLIDALLVKAHNRQKEAEIPNGIPNSEWEKKHIQKWLDEQGIEYDKRSSAKTLLTLIPKEESNED